MTLMNEPMHKNENRKKYCRFKKNSIKYIDYKDANFLLKTSQRTRQDFTPAHYRHQSEVSA